MSGIVLVVVDGTSLPAGSVSVLNYGNKLVTFIVGLRQPGRPGSAVLPHFSRMVATADFSGADCGERSDSISYCSLA